MKITNRSVATLALPAHKTDAIVFDSELPGFGLRLRRDASGKTKKTFIAQYRANGGTSPR